MPLNVQISSDQICIVIKIKAPSGIKGFYFEVHTMVLDIGLAWSCPGPLSDYVGRVLSAEAHCLMSYLAFAPPSLHPPITRCR